MFSSKTAAQYEYITTAATA